MIKSLSLAGTWRVCLDGVCSVDGPPPDQAFGDAIQLPATTETAGLGLTLESRVQSLEPSDQQDSQPSTLSAQLSPSGSQLSTLSSRLPSSPRTDRLTAARRIEGLVWYQREIEIPEDWRDCEVSLFIERTKWCRVFLDGRLLGDDPILCAPHCHRLGCLQPGPHLLALCVDNRRKPAPGDNHQTSEHTQGNWNGMLGRLELSVASEARIEHIAIVPDVAGRAFSFKIQLGTQNARVDASEGGAHCPQCAGLGATESKRVGVNALHPPINGTLRIQAESYNHPGQPHRPAAVSTTLSASLGIIELTLPLGAEARLWDEFSPALYRVTVTLDLPQGVADGKGLTIGLREFRTRGTQFTINGRTTFLRGEVNCCVFPLTGHPPMEVEGWLRYFRTLQQYGINHVRFHSWTPPDAAFSAADELGLYLQTELPFWGEWNENIRQALQPEGEAILRTYGHHPSFVLLSLGNEHRGDRTARAALIAHLRHLDPHRLYCEGANNDLETPSLAPNDDCWITARVPDPTHPGRYANVRGSFATNDVANGHLQIGSGGTRTDYTTAIAGIPLPTVSHEIGQFTVSPNFAEIARYTGVFAAHNLEYFRTNAAAAGLLEQADEAFRASGKLAALLYREEIEAALRTPGFGGFQLLGLQDFPGQGTALVGLLDAFMESKGAISSAEFRTFCAPHVLLARFDRHIWSAGEIFEADLDLAHYGPTDLAAGSIEWQLCRNEAGSIGKLGSPVTERNLTVGGALCPDSNATITFPVQDRGIKPLLQSGNGSDKAGYGDPALQPKQGDEPDENNNGMPLASGGMIVPAITQGGVRHLGSLQFTLPNFTTAQRANLTLRYNPGGPASPRGADNSNPIAITYPLWIYPTAFVGARSLATQSPNVASKLAPTGSNSVKLVRHFDTAAQSALTAGGCVVLMPDAAHPFAHSPGGGFTTDFWCWPMFHNTPGTMGLLIDAAHPALARFPTEAHSNWQWFHLARAAQPVVLDALPATLRPIVQVLDNLERVHRLGLIFEARVGSGRLLVCAVDLPALAETHPEARQLLASLLAYAGSDKFEPANSLDLSVLSRALEAKVPLGAAKLSASSARPNRDPFLELNAKDNNAFAVGGTRPLDGFSSTHAQQARPEAALHLPERICTAADSSHTIIGEWWQSDFPAPVDFDAVELVWDKEQGGYSASVEITADGLSWHLLSKVGAGNTPLRYHRINAAAREILGVRIRVNGLPTNTVICLGELRLIQPDFL